MLFLLFSILLILLIIIGVPVGFSMGALSALLLKLETNLPLVAIVQRMSSGVDSFPLMAIPFFIFAGSIMSRGIFAKKLIDFAYALVGHVRGGMGMVAVLACMFFAALSGSAVATAACIGALMIPSMTRLGYDDDFSSALVASSAVMGPIIPPSVPMIVYCCATTGASIATMFMAGVIPGVLLGISLMIVCYFTAKKKGYPVGEKLSAKEKFKNFIHAIPALMMPLIILGGIYGGIFTPTEAAVVAVLYAVLLELVFYRDMTLKEFFKIAEDSAISSAGILFVIATANAVSWVLATLRVPQMLTDAVLGFTNSKFVLLLLVNIILLIAGCFMETNAAILILAPILAPIMASVGVDAIYLGIIFIVNINIGLITPPVGMCLYVVDNISKVDFGKMLRRVIPMLIAEIAVLLLLTYCEPIIKFLPNLIESLKH